MSSTAKKGLILNLDELKPSWVLHRFSHLRHPLVEVVASDDGRLKGEVLKLRESAVAQQLEIRSSSNASFKQQESLLKAKLVVP